MKLRNCDYNTGGRCPQPLSLALHDTVILSVKVYHSFMSCGIIFSKMGDLPKLISKVPSVYVFYDYILLSAFIKKKKVSRFPLS